MVTRLKNFIVFIEDEYGVGTDIPTVNGAKVVVYSPERPEYEQFMQKIGRGPRKGEIMRGTLFTQGDPTMAGSII